MARKESHVKIPSPNRPWITGLAGRVVAGALGRRERQVRRGIDTNVVVALLTLVLLTAVAIVGALPLDLPRAVGATAPPMVFSSARAMDHVRAIAREPHPMGSPANAAAR